jgi:hypothetical protein
VPQNNALTVKNTLQSVDGDSALGSTGHWPVPSGDTPAGRAVARRTQDHAAPLDCAEGREVAAPRMNRNMKLHLRPPKAAVPAALFNQITVANARWRTRFRFRGSRHRPGVAKC